MSGKYHRKRSGQLLGNILKPVGAGILFFGASNSPSLILRFLSQLLFYGAFGFMGLMIFFGVFYRNAIDMWIQLSIYAVPISTLLCGHYAFNSLAYRRLLSRNVVHESMVTFFIPEHISYPPSVAAQAPAHNKLWMSWISVKCLLFPCSLEVLQLGAGLGFYVYCHGWTCMGTKIKLISDNLWVTLYCVYWFFAMYIVGFLAFQFVFVSRLIVRDAVGLMSLFGTSPYLNAVSSSQYRQQRSWVVRLILHLLNFFTFDLLESLKDQTWTSKLTMQSVACLSERSVLPYRVVVSPPAVENDALVDVSAEPEGISSNEASKLTTGFMFEIQDIAHVFTPFNISLSFFSVSNLITHVCLFTIEGTGNMNYLSKLWTLCRTFIWLCVCLRTLICVAQISTLLGKLESHVRYVYSAGNLSKRCSEQEWHRFLKLLSSFQLERRSYGFPLTLKQVASIATFLNMSFLIILSLFKKNVTSL